MPDQMWQWLDGFPEQVRHAAELGDTWDIRGIDNPSAVVFMGLGGSAIGATLIGDLLADHLTCPVVVSRGDTPPAWLGPGCVAVAVSYSGETVETLAAFRHALEKGATCMTISSGGTLAQYAADHSLNHLIIPSGMAPRAALGYSSIPLIYLLQKIGAISPYELDASSLVHALEPVRVEYGEPAGFGPGIARRLMHHFPVIVGAGLTASIARRFQAQLAENSKALSLTFEIPESLHNLVETVSIQNLDELKPITVYLEDTDAPAELKKLQHILRSTFSEASIDPVVLQTEGENSLERMYTLIHKIDWISYHLAKLRGIDPEAIPVIRRIKEKSNI